MTVCVEWTNAFIAFFSSSLISRILLKVRRTGGVGLAIAMLVVSFSIFTFFFFCGTACTAVSVRC